MTKKLLILSLTIIITLVICIYTGSISADTYTSADTKIAREYTEYVYNE